MTAGDPFEGLARGARCPEPPNPAPARFADDEWRLRVELAAAYRLVAMMGMDDAIFTHLSLRIPGDPPSFLINPYGMLFDEVTAGFSIHSAIHLARDDAHCIFHPHTLAGMAVAADAGGLRPLNQISLHFHRRIGRYSYDTIHFPDHEKRRLVAALGPHNALIMENHGLLVCGPSVAQAFYLMFYLERACRLQVQVLAMPGPHLEPAPETCEAVAALFEGRDRQKEDFWIPFFRRALRLAPELAT